MTAVSAPVKRSLTPATLCAVYAGEHCEQALGHAGSPSAYLLFEAPTPWPQRLFEASNDLRAVQELRLQHYREGFLFSAIALAPDPEYSAQNLTRVILLRRPAGAFDRFAREDYLLPAGRGLFPLARALIERPEERERFEQFRVEPGNVRDLLVCTHGSVDACCGRFGYPVFQTLRHEIAPEVGPGVRVWRASHFGGHRYAPTMLDLPEGRYWGFLNRSILEQVVRRSGPVEALMSHYRGWAGASNAWAQVAEGEAFRRVGWSWIGYEKEITSQIAEDERSAEVRIDFATANGRVRGAYEARVDAAGVAPLPLCGERPEEAHREGKRYQITRWRRAK